MADYLNDLLDRAVAIEKEALAALSPAVTCDAVDHFFHVQETFPYWTNRIAGMPVDHGDNNEVEQFPLPRLIGRCVVGHLTQGYSGDPEDSMYGYLTQAVSYFAKRKFFQSAAFPSEPDYLIYSEVVDGGGLRVFTDSGIQGTVQVGFEITIECRFTDYIEQVYQ